MAALEGPRKTLFVILPFVMLFKIAFAGSAEAKTSQLESLNPLALKCFLYGEPSFCDKALMHSEALQRHAGDKKNYRCQTFALGLGADLLMSQEQVGRADVSFELLRQVNKLCAR